MIILTIPISFLPVPKHPQLMWRREREREREGKRVREREREQ